jgi:hypothetical protein
MSKQLLIDAKPIKLAIQESEGGKLVARGEFARCDVPTQNGRTYPRGVYSREIKKLQESVAARRAFGELDHPEDGKTKLSRVSHVITKLEIDKNGVVMGEAEILNTPNGQTLKAILEAGAEVGVSSRGFGSTRALPDGSQMVGEDFALRSFDFVADPAMKTAYPQIFAEDIDVEFTESNLLDEFPQLAEGLKAQAFAAAKRDAESALDKIVSERESSVRSEMRESFEKNLAQAIAGLRDTVSESIREEFEADPKVGGARGLLTKIATLVSDFEAGPEGMAVKDALRAKELENAGLRESLEKAKNIARKSALALHVEHEISGHKRADKIRTLIGDITQYSSKDELDARIQEVRSEYDEFDAEQEAFEESRHEEAVRALTARIEELSSDLEEATASIDEANETIDNANSTLDRLREDYDNRVEQVEAKFKARLEQAESKFDAERRDLTKKLNEAVQIGENLSESLENYEKQLQESKVSAYKANRVAGFTNSSKLIGLLEDVDNEDAIDKIVNNYGTRGMSNRDLQGTMEKLKRGHSNPEPVTESVDEHIFRDPMLGGLSSKQMLELSGVTKRVR